MHNEMHLPNRPVHRYMCVKKEKARLYGRVAGRTGRCRYSVSNHHVYLAACRAALPISIMVHREVQIHARARWFLHPQRAILRVRFGDRPDNWNGFLLRSTVCSARCVHACTLAVCWFLHR